MNVSHQDPEQFVNPSTSKELWTLSALLNLYSHSTSTYFLFSSLIFNPLLTHSLPKMAEVSQADLFQRTSYLYKLIDAL